MAVEPRDGKAVVSGRTSFGYGLIIGIFVTVSAIGVWSHVMAKRDEVRSSGPAVTAPAPAATDVSSYPGLKTIDRGVAMTLVAVTAPHFNALTPIGWTIAPDHHADQVSLQSSDHTLYAGWGAFSQASPGGDPLSFAGTLLDGALKGFGLKPDGILTSRVSKNGAFFTVMVWQSSALQGLMLFHQYPSDGKIAVMSYYIAAAGRGLWVQRGGIALQVAASIRAQSPLIAQSAASKSGLDEALETTYGTHLGWQTVHSASRTNYIVDPATTFSVSGPYGPGFYIRNGGTYEKLDPGSSE